MRLTRRIADDPAPVTSWEHNTQPIQYPPPPSEAAEISNIYVGYAYTRWGPARAPGTPHRPNQTPFLTLVGSRRALNSEGGMVINVSCDNRTRNPRPEFRTGTALKRACVLTYVGVLCQAMWNPFLVPKRPKTCV